MAVAETTDRARWIKIFEGAAAATGSWYPTGGTPMPSDSLRVQLDVATTGVFEIHATNDPDQAVYTPIEIAGSTTFTTDKTYTILNIPKWSHIRVKLNSIVGGTAAAYLTRGEG